MTATVAAHYGISEIAARGRVRDARRDGCDVPYSRGPRPTNTTMRIDVLALVCECGHAGRVDRAVDLFRHTTTTHGRRPTKAERTPRKAAS